MGARGPKNFYERLAIERSAFQRAAQPAADPPPPPGYLGEPEREIWAHLFNKYGLEGRIDETFAALTMSAHQRARTCRERIDADGAVITGPNGKQDPHPLLGAERAAWRAYYAGIKALKLEPRGVPEKTGHRDRFGNKI
jgi:hypothetical protein